MSDMCCNKQKIKIEGIFRCLDPHCPIEARRSRRGPNQFGPRPLTAEDRAIYGQPPSSPPPKAPERVGFPRNNARPYEGGSL